MNYYKLYFFLDVMLIFENRKVITTAKIIIEPNIPIDDIKYSNNCKFY